jgi:hypothetical protein
MAAAPLKIPCSSSPLTAGSFIKGSHWIDAMFLGSANVAETYTVPAGVTLAIFSCPNNFYAAYNGATAAVPSAEVTDGSASEMNPAGRVVSGGQTISFVSATASTPISISLYSG